jgi:2-polyprenyl-3-methyl-5-hydroxy-6-metoxy-1,4-benzoquinol methylase
VIAGRGRRHPRDLAEEWRARHGGGGLVTEYDERTWEERYRSSTRVWSGRPNGQLVADAAGLAPGTALDAGCGEGADALWLAEHGWRVTAVDFSTVALARAAEHAAAAGLSDRIEWVHADLRTWSPPGSYELVSAQFLHIPPEPRRDVFARLAGAVAPGGILLVVGHDVSDLDSGVHRPRAPEMFFTAAEVAADLAPDDWEILAADVRQRAALHHEAGHGTTVADAVLVARRRGGS